MEELAEENTRKRKNSQEVLEERLVLSVEDCINFVNFTGDINPIHRQEKGVVAGMYIESLVALGACKIASEVMGESARYLGQQTRFSDKISYAPNIEIKLRHKLGNAGKGLEIVTECEANGKLCATVTSIFDEEYEEKQFDKKGYERLDEFNVTNNLDEFLNLLNPYDKVKGRTASKSFLASVISGILSKLAGNELEKSQVVYMVQKLYFPRIINHNELPESLTIWKKQKGKTFIKVDIIGEYNGVDYVKADSILYRMPDDQDKKA